MKWVPLFFILTTSVCAADFDFSNLSVLGNTKDGSIGWIKCPTWNWDLVPPECRRPAFNCVPICGKWPGDKVDIGAYEYVPGITAEQPWGVWNGVPFTYVPGEGVNPPKGFRRR